MLAYTYLTSIKPISLYLMYAFTRIHVYTRMRQPIHAHISTSK